MRSGVRCLLTLTRMLEFLYSTEKEKRTKLSERQQNPSDAKYMFQSGITRDQIAVHPWSILEEHNLISSFLHRLYPRRNRVTLKRWISDSKLFYKVTKLLNVHTRWSSVKIWRAINLQKWKILWNDLVRAMLQLMPKELHPFKNSFGSLWFHTKWFFRAEIIYFWLRYSIFETQSNIFFKCESSMESSTFFLHLQEFLSY